jgi:hypothetical protein
VGQGQFGQPPAGQGSFGAPPYGQAPAGGQNAPASPPQGAPNYGGGFDRLGPQPGQPGQQGQPGPYGSPVYGQQQGDPGRRDGGQAPTGWAEPGQEPQPPAGKSKRGLIVTVIVVAVLIVVGVGAFVGWSLTNKTSDFTVGACVKQDGSDAVITDCAGGSGVFKIASIVDAENGCPDANQPSLVLTERVGGAKKWACLTPVS